MVMIVHPPNRRRKFAKLQFKVEPFPLYLLGADLRDLAIYLYGVLLASGMVIMCEGEVRSFSMNF